MSAACDWMMEDIVKFRGESSECFTNVRNVGLTT
jgi:hypothetical protein